MDFADFFCFRLGAISRKMMRYYNNKLAPYGITIVQSWVLFYLSTHNGSSLKDIAAAVQLDSPVVTGLIDRLEKEGLVVREEDPEDRRSLKICLTPRGREVVAEITPVVVEYNQRIRSIVPGNDSPAFERALEALEREL
ncbi:MAG: MarR family winged helix-turn-helix transcriptional regulator [Syntrophomonadaceae bacterium]|nr:MarR family transcriptional regulator [Bacillota bacterium]MDI9481172.1 MarR family transcriptional regulator [Bacillota bacterium]NLP24639.1 MarR family transcriptional regulator [Syntrophomonadaceae bacterium]